MLNYPTQNPDDKELLRCSFEALTAHHDVTIVQELSEQDRVFKLIANFISLPPGCSLSLANLFCIQGNSGGTIYVVQCLQDFRFSVRGRGPIVDNYQYITIGFAELETDFGHLLVRPEASSDRLVGRFIKTDIIIPDAPEFNRKYYVAAKDQVSARRLLNSSTVKLLEKTKGAHMRVDGRRILFQFENEMTKQQSAIIVKIFLVFCQISDSDCTQHGVWRNAGFRINAQLHIATQLQFQL